MPTPQYTMITIFNHRFHLGLVTLVDVACVSDCITSNLLRAAGGGF